MSSPNIGSFNKLTDPLLLKDPGIPKDHLVDRLSNRVSDLVTTFRKDIFSVASPLRLLSQQILKFWMVLEPESGDRLKPIISGMGLLAWFNFVFGIESTSKDLEEIKENIRLGDREGTVLAIANFIVERVGVCDSFITGYNATSYFIKVPAIVFLSTLAAPIGIGLGFFFLGYSTAINTYKAVWNKKELDALSVMDQKRGDDLLRYIEERLEVTDNEEIGIRQRLTAEGLSGERLKVAYDEQVEALTKVKQRTLARHTDTKVVNIMKHMRAHLHSDKGLDEEHRQKALQDIKKITRINMYGNGVSGGVAFVSVAAMVCSLAIPTMPIWIMPTIGVVRNGVGFAKLINNRFIVNELLNCPEWAKNDDGTRVRRRQLHQVNDYNDSFPGSDSNGSGEGNVE